MAEQEIKSMKIPLYFKGKIKDYAIVDEEDYPHLSQFKWQYVFGYAIRSKVEDSSHIRMSRLITNAKQGEVVDHINRNRLDNRRSNLRLCSQSHNCFNRGINKNNTSGYKGVTKKVIKGKTFYDAQIVINQKRVYIGRYTIAEVAALAYDTIAKKEYGSFAYLNGVNEKYINYLYKKEPFGKLKKYCKFGHKFDKSNTYTNKTGGRNCRKCHALYEKKRRAILK